MDRFLRGFFFATDEEDASSIAVDDDVAEDVVVYTCLSSFGDE